MKPTSGYGKYEITMHQLFPCGAWLVGNVEAIKDFERSGPGLEGFVQALDRDSGAPLWSAVVQTGDIDNAPAWLHRCKVKIASGVRPELPPLMPGTPFRPVWFDGLALIPYVDDKACTGPENGRRHRCRAKVAYSLRATAMRAPKAAERPSPAPAQDGAA